MKMQNEPKIFGATNKTGEITRLIEADTVGQVKAHLLRDTAIIKPSALTVARLIAAGTKVEKAE